MKKRVGVKNSDKIIVIISIILISFARTLLAHSIQPKPIYYPDDEYKEMGLRIPKLPEDAIALINGKKVVEDDYINWLVVRADTEFLFKSFIFELLLERKADELGIKFTEKGLSRQVKGKVNEAMQKGKNNRKKLKKMLKSNNSTEKQYRQLKAKQFTKELEKYYLTSLVIYNSWDITEASIRKKFTEKYGKNGRKYKLEQMFFSIKKKTLRRGEEGYAKAVMSIEEEVKKKLEDVLKKINAAGVESFGRMAELYSDDEASRYKNGYRGKFIKGKYGMEFDRVVPTLEEGQISDVLKSHKGFHIVKIMKKDKSGIEISHILNKVNYYSVIDMDLWKSERKKLGEKINKLMQKATSGKAFNRIAAKESEDYNKAYGMVSSSGWENTWDVIMGNKLSELGKGDISDIIETEKGLHVVRVEDLRITEYTEELRGDLKKAVAYDMAVRDFDKFKKTLLEEFEYKRY